MRRYQLEAYADLTVSCCRRRAQAVDIAMAVVSKPRILLLDEPTSGISVEEKFDFMDVVMGVERGRGYRSFVEHDMEIVERYVSRVLAFYQGEIIADMTPKSACR